MKRTVIILFVLISLLEIIATPAITLARERLSAGGSTFIYPLMSKWVAEYEKATGVKINYQSIGSGGGIQQLTAKVFDFGCTDSPMNEEQLSKAQESGNKVLHIPLTMGAVVVAYNLPTQKEPLKFDGPLLAQIFQGKITKWNDPAIKTLNPGANLSSQNISVVHRSDGSGTTFIFADYLSKVSPEWKEKVGTATSLNWPTGIGQKGNEGVAGQVRRTPGSIGYVELIYALQNKIPFSLVQNAEGHFIEPSLRTVTAAAAAVLSQIPEDLRYSLTNASGPESYPISGTVWAVVYENPPEDKGEVIADFLRWATHEGQQFASALNYAILPPELVARVDKKIELIKNQ